MIKTYYKGMCYSTFMQWQSSGFLYPQKSQHHNFKVLYLSESKATANSYAKQVNGVVVTIKFPEEYVTKTGHSNQKITRYPIHKNQIKAVEKHY